MRNHAHAVLACDFFVAVTATFRVFYVFVVLEVGTRRILHWNVTDHPTADWTSHWQASALIVLIGEHIVPDFYETASKLARLGADGCRCARRGSKSGSASAASRKPTGLISQPR